MIPLQTISDPALVVVLLCIVLVFAIIFGFIWAFNKISQPPETHEDEEPNGAHA